MNKTPLVSIVIPAFNPRFFQTALQSALDQTWESLEIIVSDDCPNDDIRQIVEGVSVPDSVSLRYVRNPSRLGFVANLSSVVAQAQGEFLKVLCDDDRLFGRCISQQARILIEHNDVNLVLCQRFLVDANNFVLPSRMINNLLSTTDTLFKGGDMLELLHGATINILGNFSSALMRTADMQSLLPLLTQTGAGFSALLDFALFICLLRRGNMVMLRPSLSMERLHPERLSKQAAVQKAAEIELQWLVEMLAARSGEGAPAMGWVRGIELSKIVPGQAHSWEEIPLLRAFSNTQTFLKARVGSNSESYEEFYSDWLESKRFSVSQIKLMPKMIAAWHRQPRIAVIVTDRHADSGLSLTLETLERQLYPAQRVIVLSANRPVVGREVQVLPLALDWASQLNERLVNLADIDWIYLLRAGDQLFESTLLVLAERIAHLPGVQCIYSDESALVERVSQEPVFKPDFNLDLMRSYPYVGRTLSLSREAVQTHGGFDTVHGELAPHDLLWKLVETQGPQVVEHIAEMQVASTLSFAQWLSLPKMIEGNRQLLSAHLKRIGVAHRLQAGDLPLINRVEYLSEFEPLISIIVQAGKRLTALQQCIETLLEKTSYTRYEILIIDNANPEPQMTEWLDAMAQLDSNLLRVISVKAGEFDNALMKNQAANETRGDYLLFLNPEILIVSGSWLAELINHARRPEVGVVGGRTLNMQGAIVHAGLIMGLGGTVGSPFIGESASARGYMQRLQVTQNWSAIGDDCMMVNKAVFNAVGQFNAQDFPLGFNGVDLCLRIAQQGYLLVGTPYSSVALGRTGASRPEPRFLVQRQTEEELLYQRWTKALARDPAYNQNLTLAGADFGLLPGLKAGWSPFCSRTLPSILILPINSSAVGHYRVLQPLAELQVAGRVIGQSMFGSPSIIDIERISPDVIVLQCRYSSHSVAYIKSLKKHSGAMRIFELDDYVIKTPKKNTHTRNKAADIEDTLRQNIALCDRVVVSTPALKRMLSGMHSDIRVVPNMLAPHLWANLSSLRRASNRPRVGWGGGTSHTGDLEIIAEVVRELSDEVEWIFFGMCPEDMRPYIHEFHSAVDLQRYPAKLASLNLDLALAPLEFHIFNDCKSNLRLLEYGACGYPVICTDTEAYQGFLPCTRVKTNSTAEWLEAIRSHLADPEASYRMGDQLREAVLQNFMLAGDNLKHWEWAWLPD